MGQILFRAFCHTWAAQSILLVLACGAQANPVSPIALFKRCYQHVVGDPPTFEMVTRFAQMAQTTSSSDDGRRDYAINLCVELLNGVSVQSGGMLSGAHNSTFFTNDEQSTLYPHLYLNFERIHMSWFTKPSFQADDDEQFANYTVEPMTPALYWNAAFFIPGQKASSVVTTTNYYRPIRMNSPLKLGTGTGPCVLSTPPDFLTSNQDYIRCQLNSRNGINSIDTSSPMYNLQFEPGGIFTFDSSGALIYTGTLANASNLANLVVRFGQTVGLETVSSSLPYTSYTSFINANSSVNGGVTLSATNSTLTATGGKAVTGYTAKTAGGGLLGSPDYVLMNMTDYPDAGNGGLKVARDYAYDLMGDLLCKSLPALTFSDGMNNVQKTITASTPPFRSSASCMACHANLDGLAYAVRNLQVGQTNSVTDARTATHVSLTATATGVNAITPFLAKWPTTLPAVSGFTDGMTNFQNTPPTGRLYFRSYDDSLVDVSIQNGVADMGSTIAQTQDFYACTASRYFQYLTGRTVDLNAPSVSQATFTGDQITERNWVITQGQALKKDPTQNLKSLFITMLKSDWYRDQGFGGVK